MAKRHKWTFVARFRANAYGWRGSALAIQRLKEAVREINKVAKSDPTLAADGAVTFMERIWPAFQGIDTSSGALGAAVRRTLEELLPILISAPADFSTRATWTDRLYEAVAEDGVQYLFPVEDAWGDICAFTDLAERWADLLCQPMREYWCRPTHGWFVGSGICLSSLVKTGRYQEVDDLLALQSHRSWHFDKFAAEARAQQGKIEEALALAEECYLASGYHYDGSSVARFCEKILLAAGRRDEAYTKFARTAGGKSTNLGTYREIVKRYPERQPRQILLDLIARSKAKGKWFAAAKEAGFLEIALECAGSADADPATLSRAARDFAESHPEFAMQVGLCAIRQLLAGQGYEPKASDITLAYDSLQAAAAKLGKSALVDSDVEQMLGASVDRSEAFLRRALRGHINLCQSGQRGLTEKAGQ